MKLTIFQITFGLVQQRQQNALNTASFFSGPDVKPYYQTMIRVFVILLIMIPSFGATGQRLLVEDHKGRQKKIPVGRIVTVAASSDSLNSQPFHYIDPSDTSAAWCARGCYTLLAIDTISNRMKIERIDGVILDYKIADVESVWFVRAKHPGRVKAMKITLAVLGSVLIGQTIATTDGAPTDTQLGYYALGTALIGYSLLNKRNEPKKYKLVGVTN